MTGWEYYALWDEPGSSPESPYGLARHVDGEPWAFSDALTPHGTWRRSATLDKVWSRGEPQATKVTRERAVELVTRWYALGERDDIPDDLRDRPRE